MVLKQIYNTKYMAVSGTRRYTLEEGRIGVLSYGKCFRLYLDDKVIACFVTKTDGHNCEVDYSVDYKIWTLLSEVLEKANEIMNSVDKLYMEGT